MSRFGCRRLVFAVTTAGILALAGSSDAGAADLVWKFEKGEVLRYELSQKNTSKFETQGQDLESISTLTVNLTWTVDEVKADGSATITQTIQRVRVELSKGSQRIAYDSKTDDPEKAAETDDGAQTLRKFYSIATTEPYTLTVSNQGELVDVEMPPKLVDLIKEYQLQPLADTGSVLSAEGLKRMFVQFFPKLPGEPVEPGSTWNSTLEVPAGPLSLTLQTRYTLEAADAQTARISGAINTTIKPRPGVPVNLGIKSQDSSAEFGFDTSTGCLDHTLVSQTLNVEEEAKDRASKMTLTLTLNAQREQVPK